MELGFAALRKSIAAARLALAETGEPQWTGDRRTGWLQALDAIDRFLDGDESERGFSIIRSLDAGVGTDGATSRAILEVATALRLGGIDRYR
jgi:hypothetical protein